MASVTYRERLRIEGLVLAGCGALAAGVLLLAARSATDHPARTALALGAVALLLLALGPWATRRALDAAEDVATDRLGGEPTPLWQLPLIVAGLTLLAGFVLGWDGGLRAAGGCTLVGLAQALVLERVVAQRERSAGEAYVRLPGSRILRGTRLGAVTTASVEDAPSVAARAATPRQR